MKDVANKKLKWHLGVLGISILLSFVIIVIFVISLHEKDVSDLREKYKNFSFQYYYPEFQVDANEPFHALKHTLESGDVALFGSSELSSREQRFVPYNFFPKELGKNVRAFGHAGFQEKAIITELISVINPEVLENGKIVILISPSWFLDGKRMHEGLWSKEIASPVIISRIRENTFVQTEAKEYVLGKDSRIKILDSFDKFLSEVVDSKFIAVESSSKETVISSSTPDWNKWKEESQKIERSMTSNDYGINDKYFDKYIKPVVGTSKFPFKLNTIVPIKENQEIHDFEFLLELLTSFKHKPLFIILPLNKKAYSNLSVLDPTINYLEQQITKKQYPLLNFWNMPSEEGVLTDVMHTGEYGWMLTNKFIYDNHLYQ